MRTPFRIGSGTDTHRLEPGLPLIIGGVNVPHTHGFKAHSDGDVLIHAIIDALLGALGQRDIGFHFPDTDVQWKNADSAGLLKIVMHMMHEQGYSISNIDCTIHAQKPRLANHIPHMITRLAGILNIEANQLNIKAKSGEKIGFVGRHEGIYAQAVVLLYK